MSRLSLRARLVLGVLALATVGLVTADAVTYTSLRSFLVERVDAGLEADHLGAERAGLPGLGPPGRGAPPGHGPRFCAGGTGSDFVELRSASGRVLYDCGVPTFQ
jgi:two-component system OmpR family sensor kinase